MGHEDDYPASAVTGDLTTTAAPVRYNLDYHDALIAAGATVHAFKSFGSYQGDWWAKVTYNGATGWVHDYYGSCSGCDALQGEFNYDEPSDEYEEWMWREKWSEDDDADISLAAYHRAIVKYNEQLAKFGARYLGDELLTQDAAQRLAGENIEWDDDAEKMLKFVIEHSIDS